MVLPTGHPLRAPHDLSGLDSVIPRSPSTPFYTPGRAKPQGSTPGGVPSHVPVLTCLPAGVSTLGAST